MTGSNYNSVKAQDLPPYEEMIFMAIADLREEAGSAPKAILDWVHEYVYSSMDQLSIHLSYLAKLENMKKQELTKLFA